MLYSFHSAQRFQTVRIHFISWHMVRIWVGRIWGSSSCHTLAYMPQLAPSAPRRLLHHQRIPLLVLPAVPEGAYEGSG